MIKPLLNRQTINLGKLSKEHKEHLWDITISGSQAWSLINEPFNLLRKKLKIDKIHQSKYDFFEGNKKMKAVGENAMANGTHYERWILSEVENHEGPVISEDHCFTVLYPDDHRLKPYDRYITSTPDYLIYTESNTVAVLGELKASTAAADRTQMTERYYAQCLHNSYVMQASKAHLWAKNELTKPINQYIFEFGQADYDNYEDLLFNFFTACVNSDETFYDAIAPETVPEVKEPLIQDLFNAEELEVLIGNYASAKNNAKSSKSIVDKFEKVLKDNWDNSKNLTLNGYELKMVVRQNKSSLDKAAALDSFMQEYKIPQNKLDDFMKSSKTKIITITPIVVEEPKKVV